MIIGMIINSIIAYFLNSYWSGKMVNYSSREQIADIAPPFVIALIMGLSVFFIGLFLPFRPFIVLFIQILCGCLVLFGVTKIIKLDSYMEIKGIIKEKMPKNIFGGFPDGEV